MRPLLEAAYHLKTRRLSKMQAIRLETKMNPSNASPENIITPAKTVAQAAAPPKGKKRPAPAKKPARTPRKIDAGIAAIHAEAKKKVEEYRKVGASGRILKTIIGKRLAQLTTGDCQELFDELAKTCTPILIPK